MRRKPALFRYDCLRTSPSTRPPWPTSTWRLGGRAWKRDCLEDKRFIKHSMSFFYGDMNYCRMKMGARVSSRPVEENHARKKPVLSRACGSRYLDMFMRSNVMKKKSEGSGCMLHSRISCLHYPYVIRQAGDQPWNLKASHPEPALALLTKPNLRQAKWELRVFAPLHAMDSTVARARTPTHSAQHTHTHMQKKAVN